MDAVEDRVAVALERAADLIEGRPSAQEVHDLVCEIEALDERGIVRFDVRSRSYRARFGPRQIADLRKRVRGREASFALWTVVGLVSADGFARQAAIEAAQLRRGTVALIALRATDWVLEVQRAALVRLAEVPAAVLLDILPLLEVLARESQRAELLDALVEGRLANGDLRAATYSGNVTARRAAWRRLVARGAAEGRELAERAVLDRDVMVRAMAASQLDVVDAAARRSIATALLADPVGWLAGRGLAVLIELDGQQPILSALVAPSTTLRRQAREWAAIRGVDARAIYLERLQQDPSDALALTALAEIGDQTDRDLIARALADERSRVRAAALKAMARLDAQLARKAALDEIVTGRSGRAGRAASAVLREASLSDEDLRRVEDVALDTQRTTGQRLRALAVLRRARWRHLAAILQARDDAGPPLRGVLDGQVRSWIAKSSHISRGVESR